MLSYIWVGLGGAIGSVARFWISESWRSVMVRHSRLARWRLMLTGSLIIGAFAALTDPEGR